MDTLRNWLDDLLNDPAFALLAFVVTLLVRLRVWEWGSPRRKPKHHKGKEVAHG